MPENPQGNHVCVEGRVAVVHSRRLVAETLAIALTGIGIRATIDSTAEVVFALVDTFDAATIERFARAGVRVLAFGSADTVTAARAMRAGAAWQIADDASFRDVAGHLHDLASGRDRRQSMAPGPQDPESRLLDTLTRRETEVLQSLMAGRRAADIAEADYVSVTTVRNQIQSILTKLGAHSQLEAVAIALRGGWRIAA